MAIKLKVARDAKEFDDIYKLRYEVYVGERGKFSSQNLDHQRLVDRFDSVPGVANIVAYDGGVAVAAMRINRDSEIGLPAEESYDFSAVRKKLSTRSGDRNKPEITLVSGSMLVIHKDWRRKRNVIFALFKMAAGVMRSWGTTHVIGSISSETLSLYGRIGFEAIDEPKWKDEIGDSLVPILAPFNKIFDWAFGHIIDKVGYFWLDSFCDQFERLLLSADEILFSQGNIADNAYVVDDGWISVSRKDPEGNEMILANLSKGALFGELALFDQQGRSATATAITSAELISIDSVTLLEVVNRNADNLLEILAHFSKRLRETDDLALVQKYGPRNGRVQFELNRIWDSAKLESTTKSRVAKIGPQQIAKSAQVRESEVRCFLEMKQSAGDLEYGDRMIRFFNQPTTDTHNQNLLG